jgi:hypothetical protein
VPGKLEGTFVVVVAEGVGAINAASLAEALRAHGGQVAVFAPESSVDADAVAELVAELRRAGPSGREREAGPSDQEREAE